MELLIVTLFGDQVQGFLCAIASPGLFTWASSPASGLWTTFLNSLRNLAPSLIVQTFRAPFLPSQVAEKSGHIFLSMKLPYLLLIRYINIYIFISPLYLRYCLLPALTPFLKRIQSPQGLSLQLSKQHPWVPSPGSWMLNVLWPSGKDWSCTVVPQSGPLPRPLCTCFAWPALHFTKLSHFSNIWRFYTHTKNLDPQVWMDSRWFPVLSDPHQNEGMDTLTKLLHFLM